LHVSGVAVPERRTWWLHTIRLVSNGGKASGEDYLRDKSLDFAFGE
jgi:hypothetical protein